MLVASDSVPEVSSVASTTSRRRRLRPLRPVRHLHPHPAKGPMIVRHESASNASKKTAEECWGVGPEEMHPRQPCGRPDPQPDPEEQGDRAGISHCRAPFSCGAILFLATTMKLRSGSLRMNSVRR